MKIQRFIYIYLALLCVAGLACGLFLSLLKPIFQANLAFNGAILCLIALGLLLAVKNLLKLRKEAAWFSAFQQNELGQSSYEPRVFYPLKANFISNHMDLTPTTLKNTLESISYRLQDSRVVSRYLISLPIIVGLLGTFWGLSQTIGSISHMIGSMPTDVNTEFFSQFKQDLEGPLSGMGVAFSSSLFGLAGSLLLGALDLQVDAAYSHAITTIEDWLSSFMKPMEESQGDNLSHTFLKSLVNKTLESVNGLTKLTDVSTKTHESTNALLNNLSGQLIIMTDQMKVEQQLMVKLAESQLELQDAFRKLSQSLEMDEVLKKHLLNVDAQLHQMRKEVSKGRKQAVDDICDELRVLAHTFSSINDDRLLKRAE